MNQIITIIKRKITELTQNQDRKVREELENAFLSVEILVKIEDAEKRIDELSQEVEGLRRQNLVYSERYEEKERDIRRLDEQLIESNDKNAKQKAEIESGNKHRLRNHPWDVLRRQK